MNRCACRPRHGRKAAGAVSALLSGIALLLMPKCPVCLAAYVTLLTGISVSATTALHLQTGLCALCSSALGVLAWQFCRAQMSARRQRKDTSQA